MHVIKEQVLIVAKRTYWADIKFLRRKDMKFLMATSVHVCASIFSGFFRRSSAWQFTMHTFTWLCMWILYFLLKNWLKNNVNWLQLTRSSQRTVNYQQLFCQSIRNTKFLIYRLKHVSNLQIALSYKKSFMEES